MSTQLVENEIRKFLSSKEADVLSVSGHWGVGKTYAWNRYLKDAHAKGKIGLKRYSYVSLFGVNSLDELKYAIFENSVKSSEIGVEPSLETLQSNTRAATERLVRKALGIVQQTPLLKNYIGGIAPMWFSAVRETVICMDDLERRGKDLSVRDVLGLINNLKEHKRCKVCLILNVDALEADEAEFRKYLEKVVDTSLEFDPSSEECVRIALPIQTIAGKLLAQDCVSLGIKNIRLIKRIERLVLSIEPMLREFDKQVFRQAVQSLALLGWSTYQPDTAPSLDYLLHRRGVAPFGIHEQKDVSPEEAAWNALLDANNFSKLDEFDLVLLDGVKRGFFDPVLVNKRASELNKQITAAKLDNSFSKAWEMFHDSFKNNQDEVLDQMYDSFLKGVQHITPTNMSSTIALFKALGRPDHAKKMIQHYVNSRGTERNLFDLQNSFFAEDVKDPDVVQAFNNKFSSFKSAINPKSILLRMAETNSWNPEDITTLSSLPVDDYYELFKGSEGTEMRKVISASLQFDRIGNASGEMKEISARAKEALKRIGGESAINARRVRIYGVELDSKQKKSP